MASSRFAIAMATLALAACSFDWAVRQGVSAVDAGDDAGEDVQVITPGTDAGHFFDAGGDAPTIDCASAESDLAAKKAAAIVCSVAGVPAVSHQCETVVKDVCGCDFVVALPDSKGTMDYAAALKAFSDATCKAATCPSICPALMSDQTRGCFGPPLKCNQ